jgi:NifU-like protein involved in Fe-S cluster formation
LVAAAGNGPELYHEAIVAAARRACGDGQLDAPDACAEVDNPLCGDRVRMQVKVEDGRLTAIAHRVRGCLLCEAAASIIAVNAIGATRADLLGIQTVLADALANRFAHDSNPGRLVWPDLDMFAPVARHRSRHRCVMLAFEALERALAAAAPGAADGR